MTNTAEFAFIETYLLKERVWSMAADNPKFWPILDELHRRGIDHAISRTEPKRVIAFYAQKQPA